MGNPANGICNNCGSAKSALTACKKCGHVNRINRTRTLPASSAAKSNSQKEVSRPAQDIEQLTIVLEQPENLKTYGTFRKVTNTAGQLTFSKKERKRLKAFYQSAKKNSPEHSRCSQLAGDLKSLLESLNFDAAKKKWGNKKKKRAKPLKSKRPSIGVKVTTQDIINSRKGRPQIGLGLESQVVIPKVKARDVVIDKHTNSEMIKDKHILYAAGWSLEGAFAK